MDVDLNRKHIKEAVTAWIAGRQDELGTITLKVTDISDSSLILAANGRLLQIVIPSSFQMAECNSADQVSSDEVFLVTSLDSELDEVFESTLNALNEKLERVSIKPAALSEVLDHLLLALRKFEAKRGQKLEKGVADVNCRSLDDGNLAKEDRAGGTNDVSDDDNATEGGESEAEGSEDDDSPDHYGYDLASCESLNRVSDLQFRSKGFLYAMAEDAKFQCEIAQKNSDWLHPDSEAMDSAPSDGILRWCNVSPDPEFLNIHLQMELAGIVRDDGAAAALGFSLDSPVKLSLQFSKELWSLLEYTPLTKNLKPEKWPVTQEMSRTPRKDPGDEFDEETQKLRKIDQTHLYGNEVLLPELVRTFFDFLGDQTILTGKKLQNPEMFLELQQCTAMDNPFIGLLCFLSARFKALPDWCVVCWNSLPYSVCRLRTCDSEFCLFRFEELGLGAPVLQEVQNSPELIDFELSLALVATYSSRDVFEPFPAFLLEKEEIRGRSGWFSKKEKVEYSPTEARAASLAALRQAQGTIQRPYNASEGTNVHSGNKNLRLLKGILHSYPSVEAMQHCSDEVTLKKTLTKFWHKKLESDRQNLKGKRPEEPESVSEWTKKLWLPYDVLRFVLSTSRLTLYLLQGNEKLDIEHAVYQFAVLHDSPEREAHFERRRIEQGGSFFAFHGSSADNWFSILRNGLRCLSNTVYMSCGAAHGTGIYLASHMATSMGYCAFRSPGWDHGSLKEGFSVLSICEVVSGSTRSSSPYMPYGTSAGIMVVPPEHEKDVAIRYILVFKGQLRNEKEFHSDFHSITGTTMSNKTDLLQHYRNLRSSYPAKQEEQRKARKQARWESLSLVLQKQRELEESATLGSSTARPVDAPAVGPPRQLEPEVEFSQNAMRSRTAGSNKLAPSASAMQAISKEYKNIIKQLSAAADKKSQNNEEDLPILAGIQVYIPDEKDICRWRVSLSQVLFKRWPLYKDLTECARQWNVREVPVELEFIFPATYPFAPPFARVVSPRFSFHTGHVTVGGSICMELLTESGWSPACSFESVIVQIVNAMIEGGGRLDKTVWSSRSEYSEREAREAFDRVARAHGWIKDEGPGRF